MVHAGHGMTEFPSRHSSRVNSDPDSESILNAATCPDWDNGTACWALESGNFRIRDAGWLHCLHDEVLLRRSPDSTGPGRGAAGPSRLAIYSPPPPPAIIRSRSSSHNSRSTYALCIIQNYHTLRENIRIPAPVDTHTRYLCMRVKRRLWLRIACQRRRSKLEKCNCKHFMHYEFECCSCSPVSAHLYDRDRSS